MTLADFRRLRRRVIAATGAAKQVLLWRYLREKARRGVWDDRYCMNASGGPGVTPKLRKAIMRATAAGLRCSSTKRFPVGGGSWHQARDERGRGRAADLGLPPSLIGTSKGRDRLVAFQKAELARFRHSRPRWQEVIGPDNRAIVLKGAETDLVEGTFLENQHDNHVHLADAS